VSLFDRLYAAGFDRVMYRIDCRGGEAHRRQLVEDASGEVLEVGAGTGLNFRHYRKATRVVALEPHKGMRVRAERRAKRADVTTEVIDGDGMALPFPNTSFDTVVCSLVLCTIPDPSRALAEARRVLRPGVELRIYEHVRAPGPKLARWQDRLELPWRWTHGGCHPNRDTASMVEGAGFDASTLERFEMPGLPLLARSCVEGVVRRS